MSTKKTVLFTSDLLHSSLTGDKWVPTGEVSTAPYRDANNPLHSGYRRD